MISHSMTYNLFQGRMTYYIILKNTGVLQCPFSFFYCVVNECTFY